MPIDLAPPPLVVAKPPAIILPAPAVIRPRDRLAELGARVPVGAVMPGIGGAIAGAAGASEAALPSVDFRASYQDAANKIPGSYSFSGCDIGEEGDGRSVVVLGYTFEQPTGLTIGGVAATEIAQHNSGSLVYLSAWALAVASGATADIVVSVDESYCCLIDVYRVTDLISLTPVATDTDATQNPSFSLGSSADGVLLAACAGYGSTSGRSHSWSSVTERSDTDLADSFRRYLSSASAAATTGDTLTPSCTRSGSMSTYAGLCLTLR